MRDINKIEWIPKIILGLVVNLREKRNSDSLERQAKIAS